MQAVWFDRFGAAADSLICGELPMPVAGEDEVLVRLETTGVNPSDVKKRAGAFPDLLDTGLVIPHSDGAGVIEAVGPGVDPARIGERVFVYEAQYGRRFGTAAGYVALDSRRAPRLPDAAGFEVGACIGIPIMTAHRCVFADGPVTDRVIVVTGGAGRVGYYAIQWAKWGGAVVIATASNSEDEAACRTVGADHVVNHRRAGWSADVLAATGGERVDRLVEVEFGANLLEALDFLRTGATIATYSSTAVPEPALPFRRMMFMDLTLRMVIVYAMPEEAKQQAIADTQHLLEEGYLQHRVADKLPLSDMVRAHEIVERGEVRGCVVVSTR
ncbi:MAG: NADPH:quinone reductase [Pseudomonadota bacterium]